jgi:hypothetical protein
MVGKATYPLLRTLAGRDFSSCALDNASERIGWPLKVLTPYRYREPWAHFSTWSLWCFHSVRAARRSRSYSAMLKVWVLGEREVGD